MTTAFAKSRDFSFIIQSKALADAFAAAPDAAFERTQDFVDHMARSFRKAWLRETEVEFRKPEDIAPVRHSLPASTRSLRAHKAVYFVVQPRRGRRGKRTLNDISLDIFTVSQSWEALEEGAHIKGKRGGKLVIPIGITLDKNGNRIGRWSTPEKFTKANKRGDKRVLVPVKKKGWKATILFWEKRKGRSKKRKKFALIPAFMLVSQADLPAIMKFYGTWDRHESRRRRARYDLLVDITKDMANHGD